MQNCTTIMAILQKNRVETSVQVQEVLTKYGCQIRTRLGLHDSGIDACSPSGLILLQLCSDNLEINQIEKELEAIPAVKVKYMTLDF